MSTPKRRSSGRVIVASPISSGRRRSGRLSIISKPAKTSNVKVCIRVRPLNEKESNHKDGKEIIDILDDNLLSFDPVEVHAPSFHRGRPTRDPTARRNRDLKFQFGRVFGQNTSNEGIFVETTQEAMDFVFRGINCSVFAYGATGSGKTFTMLGNTENRGVIARTVHELYERIEAMKDETQCELEVSYLEVYNELVLDLLNKTGKDLQLQEGGNNAGVVVRDLSFHKPRDMDDLFRMLEIGNSNRTQHPTDANKESSRSHAVFHIYLKMRKRSNESTSTDVTMSKMALIDLAGSERAAATANCGMRFKEGANINKSLLALGNCINALADGIKVVHVPFRQSKLTRILKDSLGGNCQTIMIAAVSPSDLAYMDTQNTLRYADRAQKIKLDLSRNVYRVSQTHEISDYESVIKTMQKEMQDLRQKVETTELEKRKLQRDLNSEHQKMLKAQLANEHERNTIRSAAEPISLLNTRQLEELRAAGDNYIRIQNAISQIECQKNVLQVKLNQREHLHRQLEPLEFDRGKKDAFSDQLKQYRQQMVGRIENYSKDVERLMIELRSAKLDLDTKYAHAINAQDDVSDVTRMVLESIKYQSDACQSQAVERHTKTVVERYWARTEHLERIVETMAPLLKDIYVQYTYKEKPPPSIVQRVDHVFKLIEGGKEVSWVDENGHHQHVATSNELNYKLTDLRDCSIRKIDIMHAPVQNHSAMTNGGGGDGPSLISKGDFAPLPPELPPRQFRLDPPPVIARPFASDSTTDEEDETTAAIARVPARPPTPPKQRPLVAKARNGVEALSSSSDSSPVEDGDGTFALYQPTMPTTNGNGFEATRNVFVKANFANGAPPIGRPSLPASKIRSMVSSNGAAATSVVDAEGFKRPPLPERFARPPIRPATSTSTTDTGGAPGPSYARAKTLHAGDTNGNGGGSLMTRKPSVTSIRNSPMIRSPSQSSLNTKKTPESNGSAGKGLRRQAASSTNLAQQWRY